MSPTPQQQARIDALEAALATGAQTVEIDGRRVTYRSIDEMQRALKHVKAQAGLGTDGPRLTYPEVTRGTE